MINTTSTYPNSIDPLIYCSDVSVSKMDAVSQYENYISNGSYKLAYNSIDEAGVFGWYAKYLNLLENRIRSLQTHLNEISDQHPDQSLYSDSEPVTFRDITKSRSLLINDVWVTNRI